MDLAEQIRDAIRNSGRTQLELAAASGVPQGRISEFMAGGGMALENAGKLCAALGLGLAQVNGRKRRRA